MSSIFSLILPPSLTYFRLGGFLLLVIYIIVYFGAVLIWRFKNEIIPVNMYFQRNFWWSDSVTYVGKCMSFLIPIWVTYVAQFLDNNQLLIFTRKQQGRRILY